eukprot:scaffold98157_cov15-Tisochrysis_lutea.AAC.1
MLGNGHGGMMLMHNPLVRDLKVGVENSVIVIIRAWDNAWRYITVQSKTACGRLEVQSNTTCGKLEDGGGFYHNLYGMRQRSALTVQSKGEVCMVCTCLKCERRRGVQPKHYIG